MKKWLLILLAVGSIGGGGFAYYRHRSQPPAPTVNTAAVTRGDVVDTVGATGTLQAVTTVQVGTQVSGTIQQLYADFNSLVRKGQVLARLDPSLFETQIEQARANLIRAQADLDRLRVSLEDARTKLARANDGGIAPLPVCCTQIASSKSAGLADGRTPVSPCMSTTASRRSLSTTWYTPPLSTLSCSTMRHASENCAASGCSQASNFSRTSSVLGSDAGSKA